MTSRIDADTVICASMGLPSARSMSPVMHNAGYQNLGLNYVFVRFRVKEGEAGEAVRGIRALGIRGVSVTMPHKRAVMEYLDEIEETAARIGAVNTIVNEAGHLTGYNTDWEGAMRAVEEKSTIKGKTVVVIGAGGAARAVAFGFRQREAGEIVVLNRTRDTAVQLAEAVGGQGAALGEAGIYLKNADIVFQTTSVGMHPEMGSTPIPKEYLHPGLLVVEAVYHPALTSLLKEAQEVGCETISGFRMLLWQGVRQFELYTGVQQAPVEAMQKALEDSL